jgi:acyl dehydratase
MAINRDYAGRTFPAAAPYEVSRVKIAEFADAIGDPNPLYRDRAAAQAAGYADVIAPPTFAIVISMAGSAPAVADPGLGLNYAMVVHGEQRFEHVRPIRAGDVIVAQTTISDIKAAGRLTMLHTETQLRTLAGEPVGTARSMLVERGSA